jgi:hypothetical protein
MANSKTNGSTAESGSSKKALRAEIESKLTEALLPFPKALSEKKFRKHIKKASKLLSEGLQPVPAPGKLLPTPKVKKKAAAPVAKKAAVKRVAKKNAGFKPGARAMS